MSIIGPDRFGLIRRAGVAGKSDEVAPAEQPDAPERAVEKAIRGMLPHNSLARQQLTKLKVYTGPAHPHEAQKPVPFELTQVAQ